MENARRVEKLEQGIWNEISFIDLKAKNIFRMYEPNGEPVEDINGEVEFTADCDAFENNDGIWEITII